MTIIFFLYVVIDTARAGTEIVKSSNMAELQAMKGGSDDNILPGGITAEVDRNLRAKLVKQEEGWMLDVHREDIPLRSLPRESTSSVSDSIEDSSIESGPRAQN